MKNIQFTFDYDLETNFLTIKGTKVFDNRNYVCSIWGKVDEINLQEVLSRIEISIQNKIIEDLTKDKGIYISTKLTCSGLTSNVITEKVSSELIATCSGMHIKFEEKNNI